MHRTGHYCAEVFVYHAECRTLASAPSTTESALTLSSAADELSLVSFSFIASAFTPALGSFWTVDQSTSHPSWHYVRLVCVGCRSSLMFVIGFCILCFTHTHTLMFTREVSSCAIKSGLIVCLLYLFIRSCGGYRQTRI